MKRYAWLIPTIYILFLMLPIYWLVSMSFKTTNEILGSSPFFRRGSRSTITGQFSPTRAGIGDTSTRFSMYRSTPLSRWQPLCRQHTHFPGTGFWATNICSSGCSPIEWRLQRSLPCRFSSSIPQSTCSIHISLLPLLTRCSTFRLPFGYLKALCPEFQGNLMRPPMWMDTRFPRFSHEFSFPRSVPG